MNRFIFSAILILAAAAAYADIARFEKGSKAKGFITDGYQTNSLKTLSPDDPRHPDCRGLMCPPILKVPFNPTIPPGPDGLSTGAENIRIRFILDTIHHEVISGDGVGPIDAQDKVSWATYCESPKCSGPVMFLYDYYLPQPGATITEDLVIYDQLQIADGVADYYSAQCSDFGGGGLPAGGVLPYEHNAYINVDGNELQWGVFDGEISQPGTHTIDYSFDVSMGKNVSRFHFDGWAVVTCTHDTEL